jgi:uncharacterized membrane protein
MAGEDHPFLRPLWRRIALVGFCVAWAIFEVVYGQAFWAWIAAGMAAYGAWIFLIAYKPGSEKEKE